METKNCQNCKNDFNIELDDFAFYENIKVPAPTWCSECRFMRRLSFLNWITLYNGKCASCEEFMITSIHEDKSYRVFCLKCWWADDWDGTEYAMDYDPSRNFFEQMIELKNKSTFMALENLYSTLENSPYVNATAYQKNCFMVFNADYGEQNAYTMVYAHIKECLDGYRMKNTELCYECVGAHKSYKCIYSEEIDSCANVNFSKSCFGCNDCLGCMNLRNKSYCIFNKQYSKEEYDKITSEYNLETREGLDKMFKLSREFWLTKPQRSTNGNSLNINTTGDFVYESKNVKNCYMVSGVEDSKYTQMITMSPVKNCHDYTNWGNGAENIYECLTVGEGAYNNQFCIQCWPNAMNNQYCMYSIQAKDCFGCVNLKRKKYCILNKEYKKEEYEKLREHIIEDMKNNPYIDKDGRVWKYGEQLPFEMSPFSYNETMANYFFPLTKEEASQKKISWFETPENKYTFTIEPAELPKSVIEIKDEIINEIIECIECHKGYKFNQLEIYLHRKIGVPVSHKCWKCRFKRRFNSVNKSKLYDRNCQKCNCEIKTSYSPDRPDIVYCEKCYQGEFV